MGECSADWAEDCGWVSKDMAVIAARVKCVAVLSRLVIYHANKDVGVSSRNHVRLSPRIEKKRHALCQNLQRTICLLFSLLLNFTSVIHSHFPSHSKTQPSYHQPTLPPPKHLSITEKPRHPLQPRTPTPNHLRRPSLHLHISSLHSTPLLRTFHPTQLMYPDSSHPLQESQHQSPLLPLAPRAYNPRNRIIDSALAHIRQREQDIPRRTRLIRV